MQKLLAALAVGALVAVAVPAHANTNERNVDFLVGLAGLEAIPSGTTTLYANGEATEVTVAEAFRLAAERAGGVDLASLVASAAPGDRKGAGDVWVIEFGTGACPTPTTTKTSVPYQQVTPQTFTYAGSAGVIKSSTSTTGVIMDWTTKQSSGGVYRGGGVTIVGQSDFYCFTFVGMYLMFPFVDGVVVSN